MFRKVAHAHVFCNFTGVVTVKQFTIGLVVLGSGMLHAITRMTNVKHKEISNVYLLSPHFQGGSFFLTGHIFFIKRYPHVVIC